MIASNYMILLIQRLKDQSLTTSCLIYGKTLQIMSNHLVIETETMYVNMKFLIDNAYETTTLSNLKAQ